MYCIINENQNTLHRVTFSKSLAETIIETTNGYVLKTASYIRGKRLKEGGQSKGLYGILATAKDLMLRVHIRKELAEIYADHPSRHLEEVYLQFN